MMASPEVEEVQLLFQVFCFQNQPLQLSRVLNLKPTTVSAQAYERAVMFTKHRTIQKWV
jgi:hypothetical protein